MGIVFESRTTEISLYFSYRVLTADHGLSHVASRYATTRDGVLRASVKWDRTWAPYAIDSVDHFAHHVHAADPATGGPPWEPRSMVTLPTPPAELAWDWVIFRVDGSATLREICDAQNANAERVAAHMPALTPLDLWHASGNRWLRNAVLREHSHHEHRAIDHDPSIVPLPADTRVWVPYPKHAAGAVIHAAPNPVRAPSPGTQPNTVAVQPIPDDLIRLLREHLVPIFTQTAVLAGLNARCKAATEKGGAILVKLALLREIVDMYAKSHRRGSVLEDTSVSNLDLALSAVQEKATHVLVDPFTFVDHAAAGDRMTIATDLHDKLQSTEFARLSDAYVKGPDVVLNGFSVLTYISTAIALGSEQVFLTKKGDDLLGPARAALARFASGAGAQENPPSALHAVLAAAGGASGVATTLVGPGSLAAKLYGCVLLKLLPRALNDAAERSVILREATEILTHLGGVSAGELTQLTLLVKGSDQRAVKVAIDRLAAKAAEHLMGVRGRDSAGLGRVSGWGWANLALNVIALISSVEATDEGTARHWMNVIGGTLNAASAAVQVLKQLTAPIAAFAGSVQLLGKGVGALAAGMSIVSGCFAAYEGYTHHDTQGVAGGLLVVAGSAIALAGLAIPLWGQAAGLTMVLAGGQMGGPTPVQSYVAAECARLQFDVLHALGSQVIGRSPAMHQWTGPMSDQVHDLRAGFAALFDAASEAKLRYLDDTDDNRDLLKRLGFDEEQINEFCNTHRTELHVMGSARFA